MIMKKLMVPFFMVSVGFLFTLHPLKANAAKEPVVEYSCEEFSGPTFWDGTDWAHGDDVIANFSVNRPAQGDFHYVKDGHLVLCFEPQPCVGGLC